MPTSNLERVTIGDEVKVLPDNFAKNSKITEISIPSSVTAIGSSAFSGCVGLTGVVLPDGLTAISNNTFLGCTNLATANIPSGVTSIGNRAFEGCTSLDGIVIPEGVTVINYQTFTNCTSLTSINIPSGVTYIDSYSFGNCNALASLEWNALNCNSRGSMPTSNLEHITIGEGVTVLPDNFAKNSKITEISIPSSVTTIGSSAFSGCVGLTGVVLPDGLTAISNNTFYGCSNLATANIPSGVTSIGNQAFNGCTSLDGIVIPEGVTVINYQTFNNCSSLTSINIPSGVTYIDNYAFSYCNALTSLEWNALNCDSRGGMPTSNLEHITIGEGVTVLPGNFAKNSKITEVLIPSSVTSIGGSAFSGCDSLLSIICRAVVPPTVANDYTFQTCYATAKLKVPRGVIEDYKAANYWKNFLTIVGDEYDFEVDGIYYVKTGDNTASVTYKDTDYNTYSGTVSIPKQVDFESVTYRVTGISFEAFKDCPDLTKVTMSKRIQSIGYNAFENCTSLVKVTIPDNVTAIGANAFNGCTALTEAVIGSSVATIGTQAFNGCDNLTTVMSRSVTPPTMAGMSCFNCYETATLKVPVAAVEDYSNADYWKEFMEIIGVEINAGPGDVDGDGNIGIADVTALIDYLLTGSGTSFYEENADFDDDGNIGIADVTALIDYLLTGGDD